MYKATYGEIEAIFEKCGRFFGEMQKICDNFLKKHPNYKGYRKGGKQERRSRYPKDPDAPKKPITAYILYFKDRKQLYVEQNQNLPITDITKLIGKEWKELPKERQQIYVDKANKDKARYAIEIEEYRKRKANEAASPAPVPLTKEVSQQNKKKLHKLSDIKTLVPKKEPIEEEDIEEEEEQEVEEEVEEEEANDEEEVHEAEEEDEHEEKEKEKESPNGKSKRGNFLATSSDNELDEKIKKKVRK